MPSTSRGKPGRGGFLNRICEQRQPKRERRSEEEEPETTQVVIEQRQQREDPNRQTQRCADGCKARTAANAAAIPKVASLRHSARIVRPPSRVEVTRLPGSRAALHHVRRRYGMILGRTTW